MTQGLRELQRHDITSEFERILVPRLIEILRSAEAGHCMRVGDLELDIMIRLCGRLKAEVPSVEIAILADERNRQIQIPAELAVNSFKLIELRNPYPDGERRPPLLVFIPPESRASAEDSYGVATFSEINISDTYSKLRAQLLDEVPSTLRPVIKECLTRLDEGLPRWPFSDLLSQIRFLVTAKLNNYDHEALGAALYELALVPDFDLFSPPERAVNRIARNRECMIKLTWSPKSERGRVVDLELANRGFRAKLGNFLAEIGTEDPRHWTKRIVQDRNLWGFAFNRWEFSSDDNQPEGISISEVAIDLPAVPDAETDSRLSELAGQQVLLTGSKAPKKFTVKFKVDPHPSKVSGLSRFNLQIVSKEAGPIGLCRSKTIASWKSAGCEASVAFNNLNKVDWEEGWHFVRILPETTSGDLLPILSESGLPLPWSIDEGDAPIRRPNESDLFYVLPEGDIEVPSPQASIPKEESLLHARFHLLFKNLAEGRSTDKICISAVHWLDRNSRRGLSDTLEVMFGAEGSIHIPVAHKLKVIEQKILANPEGPLSWRLEIDNGMVGELLQDSVESWSSISQAFLRSRKRYFEALRNGPAELITQGADLSLLRDFVLEYADTFNRLIEDSIQSLDSVSDANRVHVLRGLRSILALDTVTISIIDHKGRRREAALVAPTHPLRALWLTTWAEVGQHWIEKLKTAPREYLGATKQSLLRDLVPLNFPAVIPTSSGKCLVTVDNIHPLWMLLAPANEEDPRRLVGELCTSFGLPEPSLTGTRIDGQYVADRLERYLYQHPYVSTLVINAFNAGRGPIVAEALLELQRQFSDIRFDVRLFVHDPHAQGVGEAISELLSTESTVTDREADAFITPTESHLRPKLSLSIKPISDFRMSPTKNAAHVSILFDVFPPAEVGTSPASIRECSSPVHGLIQSFETDYKEDSVSVVWRRQPSHGPSIPAPNADQLTDLLAQLSRTISSATACVATAQSGITLRPVITLALGADERALLHQIHEVSDWVMTIDRNMGIEFFDHGHKDERPDYIIDHSPDAGQNAGHRLVITSRSLSELESLLLPVLKQYGLNQPNLHAPLILDQLRSLSGRLALKLMSSSTQRPEALGLALARMFLQFQGAFSNQIIVPLDAHLDLYRTLKSAGDDIADDITLKRTDLALFDLNAQERRITCRLVEVKCYNQVGDIKEYQLLKERITQQIVQSQDVLSYHFDPHRMPIDRVDRLIKTREFSLLLEFYLNRGLRYGVMSKESADEALFLLRTLESGYNLSFTRSALIFDFGKSGTDEPDIENGIEYHRVGVDLIQNLVAGFRTVPVDQPVKDAIPEEALVDTAAASRQELEQSIPTLHSAAFIPQPRERSVSWEELRSRQILGTDEDRHNYRSEDLESASKHEMPPPNKKNSDPTMSFRTKDKKSSQKAPASPDITLNSQISAVSAVVDDNQDSAKPNYDVLLGATSQSPQYGILGEIAGRKIALDLNHTHTISLFGVQGGGKSYTLGSIAEMATLPIPGVNCLPSPLSTVIFHYSPTMDYKPEFTSMVEPNCDDDQIQQLQNRYGAHPAGLSDLVLLVPENKLAARKSEYPNLEVRALKFSPSELQAAHWRFLMGAVGNQATYIRQLNMIMRSLRDELTLDGLRSAIDNAAMPDHLKDLARVRLELAAQYISNESGLGTLLHPGRMIIVDLRDEFIEKDEALGLFVVLLQIFADARFQGRAFNKLVVFDEAHKYIESADLVAGLIEVVREMRHKGTSILVASQDPPSVPIPLIELSSQIILHRFNSPAWLKHIQKANAALTALTPEKMAQLGAGEAFIWSSKATDDAFSRGVVKIKCRPRATMHGGGTKTAVGSTER